MPNKYWMDNNNMENIMNNLDLDALASIIILAGTAASALLLVSFFGNYIRCVSIARMRQEEAVRAQEGLPNDLAFTAEDLRENPELAEMFGVTDVNNDLHLNLETNAHLEYLNLQNLDGFNIMDHLDLFNDFQHYLHTYANDVFNFIFSFLF
jgi:hypothetical protein